MLFRDSCPGMPGDGCLKGPAARRVSRRALWEFPTIRVPYFGVYIRVPYFRKPPYAVACTKVHGHLERSPIDHRRPKAHSYKPKQTDPKP